MDNLEAAYLAILTTLWAKLGWEFPKAYRHYRKHNRDLTDGQAMTIGLIVWIISFFLIWFSVTMGYVLISEMLK